MSATGHPPVENPGTQDGAAQTRRAIPPKIAYSIMLVLVILIIYFLVENHSKEKQEEAPLALQPAATGGYIPPLPPGQTAGLEEGENHKDLATGEDTGCMAVPLGLFVHEDHERRFYDYEPRRGRKRNLRYIEVWINCHVDGVGERLYERPGNDKIYPGSMRLINRTCGPTYADFIVQRLPGNRAGL